MTGIDHGDDLVCAGGDFLCGLCQLGVGDRLAIVGQQPFNAAIGGRVPIACAVPRKIDEAAAALLGALAQLPDFLEDVFFGGVLVPQHANLVARNAHRHGNPFGAFHVMGHALERGGAGVGAVLAQADDQGRSQSRCLRVCWPGHEQCQRQKNEGIFFHAGQTIPVNRLKGS